MKHYYVDGIILTPNLIQIFYSFPEDSDNKIKKLYEEYFVAKTKYWIEKCFTVRKDFLFPVGAICRVVDIVKFQKDKDALSDEELLTIQNYYIDELLESEHRVNYLQYTKAVIVNDNEEFLVMKEGEEVIAQHIFDKNDVQTELKKKFELKAGNRALEIEIIELGSYINYDNALIYCYVMKCNKQMEELNLGVKWIKKEDLYIRLRNKKENMLIKLLDNFYFHA